MQEDKENWGKKLKANINSVFFLFKNAIRKIKELENESYFQYYEYMKFSETIGR